MKKSVYLSLNRYWITKMRPWRDELARRVSIGADVPLHIVPVIEAARGKMSEDTITMPTVSLTKQLPAEVI